MSAVRCESPNHRAVPNEVVDPFTCLECGRVCCEKCEGCADDEMPDACDICWNDRRVQAHVIFGVPL